MLRVLDLFSGIGGFSLGLERTGGFETVAFCEIEPFCQRVLAKHWPKVPIYDDIKELTGARLAADGIAVDVICGGFPCQDISVAGRREGLDGERSGLWSEVARLVGEIRPEFLFVENVSGLLSGPPEQPGGWFGRVLGDLATVGYDAEWHCIPASAIGAPHQRDRIWIAAYPSEIRRDAWGSEQSLQGTREPSEALLADAKSAGLQGHDGAERASRRRSGLPIDLGSSRSLCFSRYWSFEPELGRVADGISNRVDRIAALGNAVVPQIPEMIGNAILHAQRKPSDAQER